MSSNDAADRTEEETAKPQSQTTEPAAAPEAMDHAGGEAVAEDLQASPDDLRLMLEDARAKADEHWDALLRAKAEIENLRRRAERDVENAHKFGAEQYISEILPVWDSLEMGLAAASEEGADVEKVREGMDLTLKMLVGALEKMGVKQVNPVGEAFDPEHHQAMTMQETTEVEPGRVATVIQKGYTLHGRLIRPALVIVAKKPQ